MPCPWERPSQIAASEAVSIPWNFVFPQASALDQMMSPEKWANFPVVRTATCVTSIVGQPGVKAAWVHAYESHETSNCGNVLDSFGVQHHSNGWHCAPGLTNRKWASSETVASPTRIAFAELANDTALRERTLFVQGPSILYFGHRLYFVMFNSNSFCWFIVNTMDIKVWYRRRCKRNKSECKNYSAHFSRMIQFREEVKNVVFSTASPRLVDFGDKSIHICCTHSVENL